MYERELECLRDQLDRATAEKNARNVEATTPGNLAAYLKAQLDTKHVNRKRLEVALANTHRLIGEKDAAIQDL